MVTMSPSTEYTFPWIPPTVTTCSPFLMSEINLAVSFCFFLLWSDHKKIHDQNDTTKKKNLTHDATTHGTIYLK